MHQFERMIARKLAMRIPT